MCLPGKQIPFCRHVAKSLKESLVLSWNLLNLLYVSYGGFSP